MKTKGIAMFQYHREDDTPSPTYENKLGFFNGARVWLVRRLHIIYIKPWGRPKKTYGAIIAASM
jgi:hypothetical protein